MKTNRKILISILAGICLLGIVLFPACSAKPAAKTGDTVQVNYTLSLADGTMYETSVGKQPLEFVIGKGSLLPDLENAVVGMKVGESKTINISAAKGYGEYDESLVLTVDRRQLPEGLDPKVGDTLQSVDPNGQVTLVKVTIVTGTTITVDGNGPLAGKDLTFKIDLLKIN